MNAMKFSKQIFFILYIAFFATLALLYAGGMIMLQMMVMEEPDYTYTIGLFFIHLIFLMPLALLVWGCYLGIRGYQVFTQDEPLRRSKYSSLQ